MKRNITAALSIGVGLGLIGCADSPSILDPRSPVAAHQAQLLRVLIYLSVGVFVLVEGLLIYNVVRFRERDGDSEPPRQIYGNMRLEIIWTALPLVLVAVLFVLTVQTVSAIAIPRASSNDVNVHVIGHRWWWEYDYPDYGIITANELHVPQGGTIQLTLDSVDVIHSYWIPQMAGKTDVIPGQTNTAWFRADEIGEFYGQCAEFCGLNHANMRIKVVVQSQEDFDAWVANQQKPAPMPEGPAAEEGHDMITEGICEQCHSLTNEPTDKVGPNLNHLFSRSVFAGATYDLTEENIRRWLTENKEMKPGNDMSVNLTPQQVDELMAYLTTLQ
jgi:cytochrome c oxidase subunit 2